MHEEAELGVCAHWAYKDGIGEDESYARKMDWMRQVVEWQEEAEEHIRQHQIGLELGHRVREERIFVYTPKGHVLDLTTGATALDFAYRVHTEVGHRCIGARVDGRAVALNQPLESGQRVEVMTSDTGVPSRAWLHQHLDCIRTARAREKISEWFHDRPDEDNRLGGRNLLEQTFARLGLPLPGDEFLARASKRLGFESEADCLGALGNGDCQLLDLLAELLPADVRRQGTSSGAQMSLIDEVASTDTAGNSYHVEMLADDRSGLLMDITTFLGSHGIMLLSNSGRVIPSTSEAVITIEVQLDGLIELQKLLDALEMIPAVRAAKLIERNDPIEGL